MSTQTLTSDMKRPKVVSAKEWEVARQKLLVREKELTRARDALAAGRRRMPWVAVEKKYEFDGPKGKASLLDLFDGRRQLIIYRAFFEPGVTVGRNMPALAARWWPIRSLTPPISTLATPLSCSRHARHRRTSSA